MRRFFALSMPLLIVVSVVSAVFAGRMWWEYSSYRDAAHELHALQEEYRSYLSSLKDSLKDPNDASLEDEKKKSFIILDRNPKHLQAACESHVRRYYNARIVNGVQEFFAKTSASATVRRSSQQAFKRKKIIQPCRQVRRRIYRDIVLSWPIDRKRYWLSSFFGPRRRTNGTWGYHYGLDMAALKGTPVKAAASGRVIEAGYAHGYGNTIVVSHNNTYSTRYAHLHSICIRKGQQISRGQRIGLVGDTGFVRKAGNDASHLHFEVYRYQRAVNPMAVLA